MKIRAILKSEEGIVIVIALIMLALLSLIGIAATTTSTVDIQIAGNERDYKQLFYLAEAAAMDATQQLANDTNTAHLLVPPSGQSSEYSWLRDDAVDLSDEATMKIVGVASTVSPNITKYAATFDGVATGSSLDITQKTRLYLYTVYGYASDRGHSMVAVGFMRRF